MRLGSYRLADDSVAEAGRGGVDERHRHRYEVNNAYREGSRLRGRFRHLDGALVEFVELRETHPYYVSTQAHPEFKSRPHRAHPLFAGLVEAAVDRQRESLLLDVERPKATVDATA